VSLNVSAIGCGVAMLKNCFVVLDLKVPELRETIGVLECTQYQGDIAFAPEAYVSLYLCFAVSA